MQISYIVLYLQDTTKGLDFWTNKIGFIKKKEKTIEGEFIYTVGNEKNTTNFELIPLKLMENNPYNLNLGIPSIALEIDNLDEEHESLIKKNVKVSDIINHAGTNTFTIFDHEDNAYAVVEST